MDNLHKMLLQAKKQGITIKYLAQLSDINISTLYNFSCGKRKLSKEKEEKIKKILLYILK